MAVARLMLGIQFKLPFSRLFGERGFWSELAADRSVRNRQSKDGRKVWLDGTEDLRSTEETRWVGKDKIEGSNLAM
jgi:hypothetical protein